MNDWYFNYQRDQEVCLEEEEEELDMESDSLIDKGDYLIQLFFLL